MQKLYCYVDETGQDTKGALFSVCCTIMVSAETRDHLEQLLFKLEQQSQKKSKWQKTDKKIKNAFLETLIAHRETMRGHIFIEHFYKIVDFTQSTAQAIARSIIISGNKDLSAIIYIDGLPKKLRNSVAVSLRQQGIITEKIKGLKDEQSALIRLSDTIAGFVRDYLEGEDYAKPYFLKLLESGVIVEI